MLIADGRTIAMSYNGVLSGEDPMDGYDPKTGETKTVHAEANLIAFCARKGIATENCELWVTMSPCIKCAELIIQAGISRVIYIEEYRDNSGIEKLLKHGINISRYGI